MYYKTELTKSLTVGLRENGYPTIQVLERDGFDPLTFTNSRSFVFTLDGEKHFRSLARINDPENIAEYNERYKCDYEVERYSVLLTEMVHELTNSKLFK